jgi:hypothetical protein
MLALGEADSDAVAADADANRRALTYAADVLFVAALCISVATDAGDPRLADLTNLLTELVDAWPQLARAYRPVIAAACEELATSDARHFWPLLVRLRAEK